MRKASPKDAIEGEELFRKEDREIEDFVLLMRQKPDAPVTETELDTTPLLNEREDPSE